MKGNVHVKYFFTNQFCVLFKTEIIKNNCYFLKYNTFLLLLLLRTFLLECFRINRKYR